MLALKTVLAAHDPVRTLVVFDDLGHVPHAFVRLSGTTLAWTEAGLLEALGERLAPVKMPRAVTFVSEPIRDDAGKIRRSAWRERLRAA